MHHISASRPMVIPAKAGIQVSLLFLHFTSSFRACRDTERSAEPGTEIYLNIIAPGDTSFLLFDF